MTDSHDKSSRRAPTGPARLPPDAPRTLSDAASLQRMDLDQAADHAADAAEANPSRRPRRRTLFARLLIVFFAVLATYAAFSQLLAYRIGADVLADAFQSQLSAPTVMGLADATGDLLADGASQAAFDAFLEQRYGAQRGMTAAVYDADGRLLAQQAGRPGSAPEVLPREALETAAGGRMHQRGEALGFVAVAPVWGGAARPRTGPPKGFVRLAAMPSTRPTIALVAAATWQWALPVALLGALAAYLGTRSITERLRKAEAAVRRMARGDLSARIPVEANDEIGRVGVTFNRTADLLERTVRELEATDANRRRLVADFAHELNTPLTNVLAYLETLLMAEEDGSMDATTRRGFLEVAHDEGKRLAHLARDLETLTKLEAGRLVMERQVVDLSRVGVELARRIIPRAEQQGLEVHTDIEPDAEIVGDRMRLEQVGMNLLENALRYTNEGSLTIRVGHTEDGVVVEICDTGVGIPEEDLPRVLDRFYRVDASRTRSTGGSGLGLAIVGGIVKRHRGTIELRSRVDEGTTVHLWFPREGSASASEGGSRGPDADAAAR